MKSLKITPPNTTIRKVLSLLSSPNFKDNTPIKKLKLEIKKPNSNELKTIGSNLPLVLRMIRKTKNKAGKT
jgi:hypothetical protein